MANRGQSDRLNIGADTAGSNRNFTGTLAGTCLAILTFLLFFLYPRFLTGEIDPAFFQATLAVITIAIFSFAFSGLYYYGLLISLSAVDGREVTNLAIADATLILGILLLVLEPVLIMFTLRLTSLGTLAAALWVFYLFFVLYEARRRSYGVSLIRRNQNKKSTG